MSRQIVIFENNKKENDPDLDEVQKGFRVDRVNPCLGQKQGVANNTLSRPNKNRTTEALAVHCAALLRSTSSPGSLCPHRDARADDQPEGRSCLATAIRAKRHDYRKTASEDFQEICQQRSGRSGA